MTIVPSTEDVFARLLEVNYYRFNDKYSYIYILLQLHSCTATAIALPLDYTSTNMTIAAT